MKSDVSWVRRLYRRMTRVPRTVAMTWRILSCRYGHLRSVRASRPVDAAGREIPWFTYPAIDYLDQLDFRSKSIFEFGAGNSTIFWSGRSARVLSVESSRIWYDQVKARIGANVALVLEENPELFPCRIRDFDGMFDVIVVDGIERRRCCAEALPKLAPGGLVILDNSDWYEHCAADLRAAGLLQVDFSGFGPSNGYTWTTSCFFRRDFSIAPQYGRQPKPARGSLSHREGAR